MLTTAGVTSLSIGANEGSPCCRAAALRAVEGDGSKLAADTIKSKLKKVDTRFLLSIFDSCNQIVVE